MKLFLGNSVGWENKISEEEIDWHHISSPGCPLTGHLKADANFIAEIGKGLQAVYLLCLQNLVMIMSRKRQYQRISASCKGEVTRNSQPNHVEEKIWVWMHK